MWEAWSLSKTLRVRPSELHGIHHPVRAYCFDRAVATFGMALEADLDEASNKAKNSRKAEQARQRVLSTWLGIEMKYKDPGGASPKAEVKTTPDKSVQVDSETAQGPVSL